MRVIASAWPSTMVSPFASNLRSRFAANTFGAIIATVTCYHGLAQPLRLEEVSSATVRAVAQSMVLCVLLDALFIVSDLVA